MAGFFRRAGLWGALLVLVLGWNAVFAQDNGVISDIKYFEGAIHYKFTATGPKGPELYQANSIDLMTLYIKDGDFIVQLYSSPKLNQPPPPQADPETPPRIDLTVNFPTTRLYIADSDRTYLIDAKNERYFLSDGLPVSKKDTVIPVAESNGDSVKILGKWCYGYKYTNKEETVWLYICPDYRVNTGFFIGKKRCKANFLTKGINGCIPLKIIRKTKDLTIVNTATKIVPAKFSNEQFRIPGHFKRFRYDYRR